MDAVEWYLDIIDAPAAYRSAFRQWLALDAAMMAAFTAAVDRVRLGTPAPAFNLA